MTKKQAFEELGLDENASPKEIKQAWRDLVSLIHPDKHQNNKNHRRAAEALTKKINEAYDRIQKGKFSKEETKTYQSHPQSDAPSENNTPPLLTGYLILSIIMAIITYTAYFQKEDWFSGIFFALIMGLFWGLFGLVGGLIFLIAIGITIKIIRIMRYKYTEFKNWLKNRLEKEFNFIRRWLKKRGRQE